MPTPADPTKKYRAFISYSHRDEGWSEWLHRALETWRVPKHLVGRITASGQVPARLAPVFRDRDELPSAHDLSGKVTEALAQSAALIVVCSPNAAASRWVNEEILAYKRLGGADRIYAIIVGGEPNASEIPGREAEECFPPALRFDLDADGQLSERRAEPIAADARAEGDGKDAAKLKLLAGLLGVGYDDLRQREQQRRQRRMAWITAASLSISALTLSLAIVAQRARVDAEKQRSQAEGLIEFMLGDLRQKLEPVGRLDVLDVVGEKALSYYKQQGLGALDADSLGRRARALHLIGDIDTRRGDYAHASAVFTEAAKVTAEQLRRKPNDGQRIFEQAQSEYWIGYVDYRYGDLDAAEKHFNRYKELAEALVRLDPDKPEWQMEMAYALGNMGTIFIGRRQYSRAEEAWANSLRISSNLVDKYPQNIEFVFEKAQCFAYLADIAKSRGNFSDARAHRLRELSIYASLQKADGNTADVSVQIINVHLALSEIARALGQSELARQEIDQAVKLSRIPSQRDPSNLAWQIYIGCAQWLLAQNLIDSGDWSKAELVLRSASEIGRALLARDAPIPAWRTKLTIPVLLLEAKVQAHAKHYAQALRLAEQATEEAATLIAHHSNESTAQTEHTQALLASTEQLLALGRRAEAEQKWQEVVSESELDKPIAEWDVAVEQAIVAWRLGKTEDAIHMVDRLERFGIRSLALMSLHEEMKRY